MLITEAYKALIRHSDVLTPISCLFYRGFKLIRMSTNREGETAVTIPLQYNEAVSNMFITEKISGIGALFC